MNVPLIAMPQDQARQKLDAYKRQLRQRADDEYAAAAAGYKALADGKPLIVLSDAIASGGVDDKGRPRLAIARADRLEVRVRTDSRTFRFSTLQDHHRRYRGNLRITVVRPGPSEQRNVPDGYAMVPMVPADKRPDAALSNYFVLWEVEQWASQSNLINPDRDPYLLQHITGELYAVIAEWDLTELERAVMTGRRPQ